MKAIALIETDVMLLQTGRDRLKKAVTIDM